DELACDRTSGYDFMEEVSTLLHDCKAAAVLANTWASVSGRAADFEAEEQAARREILARSFTAQLESCANAFHQLAWQQTPGADISRAAIRRVRPELRAHVPIYPPSA